MLNMLYQAKQLLIEFHQSVIMYVILLYSNCDFNMIELTKRRRDGGLQQQAMITLQEMGVINSLFGSKVA